MVVGSKDIAAASQCPQSFTLYHPLPIQGYKASHLNTAALVKGPNSRLPLNGVPIIYRIAIRVPPVLVHLLHRIYTRDINVDTQKREDTTVREFVRNVGHEDVYAELMSYHRRSR